MGLVKGSAYFAKNNTYTEEEKDSASKLVSFNLLSPGVFLNQTVACHDREYLKLV